MACQSAVNTLAQYNSKENSICQRKIVAITPTPTDDEKKMLFRAGDDHLCFAFVSLWWKTCFGIHVRHFAAVLMFRNILNKNIKVQEMSQLRLSLKYYYIFEVL